MGGAHTPKELLSAGCLQHANAFAIDDMGMHLHSDNLKRTVQTHGTATSRWRSFVSSCALLPWLPSSLAVLIQASTPLSPVVLLSGAVLPGFLVFSFANWAMPPGVRLPSIRP